VLLWCVLSGASICVCAASATPAPSSGSVSPSPRRHQQAPLSWPAQSSLVQLCSLACLACPASPCQLARESSPSKISNRTSCAESQTSLKSPSRAVRSPSLHSTKRPNCSTNPPPSAVRCVFFAVPSVPLPRQTQVFSEFGALGFPVTGCAGCEDSRLEAPY
jgi:hypothetical protein